MDIHEKPELLAPAGEPASLKAALDAGADAVYFGVGSLNMRKRAKNFRPDELGDIVKLVHSYDARAYLTVNTIIFENELDVLNRTLDLAAQNGVDAVICWDQAVMDAAKDRGLEIHLSTQASVSNSRGIVRYYRNDGIKRFVLARECTLEHIKLIRSNLRNELGAEADRIELETFIHGAMCVSVSGRCFMSESATGESGNRGACLQPCRREYRIIDVEGEYEFEIGRDYVMSPRDLCTMPFLEKILEAPIASLKIEGRMRSPEYAAVVVGSYRKAVDFYFDNIESFRARNAVLSGADGGGAVPEENPGGGRNQHDLYSEFEDLKVSLTEELKNVFNRGFYSGYFMGRPVGEWAKTGNSQARMKKETVGAVTNYYQKIGVAEILVQGASFSVGDELVIQGPTTGNMFVKVGSIQVDHASVDKAEKGSRVALKVPGRVRLSDSVFRRFPV